MVLSLRRIRATTTTLLFLDQPLTLYVLAARNEEAEFTSRHTLSLPIHDKRRLPILDHIRSSLCIISRMSWSSAYLNRIIEFHRERRDQYQRLVLQRSRCFGINEARTNCGVPYKNGGLGHMAKYMVMSTGVKPSGSEID